MASGLYVEPVRPCAKLGYDFPEVAVIGLLYIRLIGKAQLDLMVGHALVMLQKVGYALQLQGGSVRHWSLCIQETCSGEGLQQVARHPESGGGGVGGGLPYKLTTCITTVQCTVFSALGVTPCLVQVSQED